MPSRAFWRGTVAELLRAEPMAVIGQLASRHVTFHAAAEAGQLRAWKRELDILRAALGNRGEKAEQWGVLLEAPLLRLGKRLDTVLLMPGVAAVIEFKTGASQHNFADREQVERYALLLRDFHLVSQSQLVVPILCADGAADTPAAQILCDGVMRTLLTNAQGLRGAIDELVPLASPTGLVDVAAFDMSPYCPTPTIIEAARALYAGNQIAEIGRGDAEDVTLQATASTLRALAREAERDCLHLICFVTGAPGAGKTLLGLDVALRSRDSGQSAALLSGNRPLVHVLTEALAADNSTRHGRRMANARHEAGAAIQGLLGFLKEHTDGPPPPEHVIVFDEAQRAWDEKVGQELMGRPRSEPALFLDILSRLDWSCLICVVGPGQEINRGEGGLALWGKALEEANDGGQKWSIVAAPQALAGGADVSGPGLRAIARLNAARAEPKLHLPNALRSYRSPDQGRWVAALLEDNIDAAAAIAANMNTAPAFLCRDLAEAKAWLRERRRGGRSVGLLASSGAVRLLGEGLPPTLRSNDLAPIAHWFLKPWRDFRSAGALEVPMSEFGCQGLELDYASLSWGGDLIWQDGGWMPRRMSAPRWVSINDRERRRFRLNAYRVLLTRARAGMVIHVPRGSAVDPTRNRGEMDQIADSLLRAGASALS